MSSIKVLNSCNSLPAAGDHEHRCLEEREQANRASAETGLALFIPVCRDDGTYVEVRFTNTSMVWKVGLRLRELAPAE